MIGEEQEPATDRAEEAAPEGLNLSDPEQVRKRNKRTKARDELRKRFMARLLSDRDGREWCWNLLSFCKVYQTSFISGAPDATAFNEGGRNVGLYVLDQIPPDAMKLMMQESAGYDG